MARVINHGKAWTPAEDELLRKLYPVQRVREFVTLFDRSPTALSSRAKVLALRKQKQRKAWTAADFWMLQTFYPHIQTLTLARRINSTLPATYQQANKLGLSKSAIFMASPEACRLRRGDNVGAAFRFHKGQVPPNKGLRMPGWGPGRMKETQFKKGERSGVAAKNWRPIGTILADSEGFLRIKVREGTKGEAYGFGNTKIWPLLNRHVWQQHNGPIPEGHMVAFKDRNRANCAIENLELISLADNMRRNTMHNLPAPLKQVIQLTGALKRKIRNREEKLNGKEHVAGPAGSSVRHAGSAV
jgi:HNH endonuclease